LSKATGWSLEDVMDENKNLDKDPSTCVGKYQKIFEDCLLKAITAPIASLQLAFPYP